MGSKATGLLTKTALEAARDQFISVVGNVLDPTQVVYSIDAVNSSLTISGREMATDGEVGKFVGSYSLPFTKVDINQLLPYPIYVDVLYPAQLRVIKTFLKNTYDLVFEEGELAYPNTPTVPIDENDYLDLIPDESTGHIELVITDQSGRFMVGGIVRLLIGAPEGRRRLNDTFTQSSTPSLEDLKSSVNSTSSRTIYSATPYEIGREFVRRHFGTDIDTNHVTANVVPINHLEGKVLLGTLAGGSMKWSGAAEVIYRTGDPAVLVPDVLSINLQYPTTFDNLKKYIESTYGLVIDYDEVTIGEYDGEVATFGTALYYPLTGFGFLDLYVQPNSLKWKGRRRFRLQFIESAKNEQVVRIVNTAPNGSAGVLYEHQTETLGAEGALTYSVVRGTPPVPLDSVSGAYSGTPSAGNYVWTVAAKDAFGYYGLRTEMVVIS